KGSGGGDPPAGDDIARDPSTRGHRGKDSGSCLGTSREGKPPLVSRALLAFAAAVLGAAPVARAGAGAVATEHPLAAAAGAEMLRAGGTVVDAAVAAAAAVCVVHASSCGLGGGGFALVHRADGRDVALDYREEAPGAATPDRFFKDGRPDEALARSGGLAVGVPGEAAGLTTLHRRFGRLPLARVLAPAIRLAGDGFPLVEAPYLCREIERSVDLLRADPGLRAGFLGPDGGPPPAAFRARSCGAPPFGPVPPAALLAPPRLGRLRARLSAVRMVEPRAELASEHGTAHVSVVDAAGNAAAITTTINTAFGAGIMVPGTGIILNNEMDDFALAPGVPNAFGLVGAAANALAPRKRPQSSMSPTVVLAGRRPALVAGGSGGPTIISGILQVLLGVVAFGRPLEAAVAAPRIHDQ